MTGTRGQPLPINKHLLGIAVIASAGGLLFGFDTAVIAGTTTALTAVYGLTAFTLGITVSSALWGTVVGAAIAGTLSDRFGRQSIGSFSHWFMNAVVSFLFPILATRWGSAAPFYFFASMTALQFFVVMKIYPETRGVSLEDMEARLHVPTEAAAS